MDKKITWWLTALAAGLFLFIVFVEHRIPSRQQRAESPRLLAVTSNAITALEVALPGKTNELRAEKAAGEWRLVNPSYRAQQTRIDNFTGLLSSLRAYDVIPPHEVLIQGQAAYGFDRRDLSFTVETATNRVSFEVGSTTPLTNNVYVRRRDTGEVFVTDASVLAALPRSASDWRSAFLVQLDQLRFDRFQISSGQRTIQISRNPTNGLWHLTRPVPLRADQHRVDALLQLIRMSQATEFVTDNPADLDRYGLQAPSIGLTFLNGTNDVYSIQFGNAATNETDAVYARLAGSGNIVKVNAALAAELNQPYKNFQDSRLVAVQPPLLDRLLVRGVEDFTLQKQDDGRWQFEESRTFADPALMRLFITNLASLEIVDIAKELPTETDLKAFGFENPVATYAFAQKMTNATGLPTNITVTEVSFGSNKTDVIYVRRSDETPVYLSPLGQAYGLPRRAFQIRVRRIWSFAPTNVLSVTLINSNGTNQLTRHPALGWSPDPIANAAIDEMVFRLSQAESLQWVARGDQRLTSFGIDPPAATVRFEVRNNGGIDNHEVKFGRSTPRGNFYAAAILPGESEHLIFEFPRDLFQQLLPHLPAPR